MKRMAAEIVISEQRLHDLKIAQSKIDTENRILKIRNINGEAFAKRNVKVFERECEGRGIAEKKVKIEETKNDV